MTEYLDLDLDLNGDLDDNVRKTTTKPPFRVEPGIKKRNTANLLKLDLKKYQDELARIAWRFADTTARILEPETWGREIPKLLLIDPEEPDGDELTLEELDNLVTSFLNGKYSKAEDRSIVLFNDPEIKKYLVINAGIRDYNDYEH